MLAKKVLEKIQKETSWDCHIEREEPLLIQGGHSRDIIGWMYGYDNPFIICEGVGYKAYIDGKVFSSSFLEDVVDKTIFALKEIDENNKRLLDEELDGRIKELNEGNVQTISYENMLEEMKSWDDNWDLSFKKEIKSTFEHHPEFGTVLSGTRIQISSFIRELKTKDIKTISEYSGLSEDKLRNTLETLAISLVHKITLP